MLKKKLINLLYTLALYAKDKLLDAEIWALKCTVRTLEAQGRILDRVLKLTKVKTATAYIALQTSRACSRSTGSSASKTAML